MTKTLNAMPSTDEMRVLSDKELDAVTGGTATLWLSVRMGADKAIWNAEVKEFERLTKK
jgi:bacteriocin-like protein